MNDTTIDLFALDDVDFISPAESLGNDVHQPAIETDFISPAESLENNVHDVHHVHRLNLDAAIDAKSEALSAAKDTVDAALAVCIDNPAILGSDEFKNAVNVISLGACRP